MRRVSWSGRPHRALAVAAAVLAVVTGSAVAGPAPGPSRAEAAPAVTEFWVGNVFPIPAPYRMSLSDNWGACRDGCARRHKGNDIFAAEGTPLVAVEAGWILAVQNSDTGLGGLTVWLLGDSGNAYYYAHNSRNDVVQGQRVRRNEVIARVGHTGNARTTPPHVHFQVNTCGERSSDEPCTVDPHPLLVTWPQVPLGTGDGIGFYRPTDGSLHRRSETGSNLPAKTFLPTHEPGIQPLGGDWDGDGRDTLGLFSTARGTLLPTDLEGRAGRATRFGTAGDAGVQAVAGDWDGDGRDTVGLYTGRSATFVAAEPDGTPAEPLTFGAPGNPGAQAVAGDWDGDGRDTLGLYSPRTANFVAAGADGTPAAPVRVGTPGQRRARAVAGDWDGDGRDALGLYLAATGEFHLPTRAGSDPTSIVVRYGDAGVTGIVPLVGDWKGRQVVTQEDLRVVFGELADRPEVRASVPYLNKAMVVAGATTPARMAAFVATVRHESGLRADAVSRGADPYRGRGFIQLTSRGNYAGAGRDLGLNLVDDPNLAAWPEVSARVAAWYWSVARNINAAADRLDMAAVNIAIGYRADPREDIERCLDFVDALEYFSGAPAGPVNCQRTAASWALALTPPGIGAGSLWPSPPGDAPATPDTAPPTTPVPPTAPPASPEPPPSSTAPAPPTATTAPPRPPATPPASPVPAAPPPRDAAPTSTTPPTGRSGTTTSTAPVARAGSPVPAPGPRG